MGAFRKLIFAVFVAALAMAPTMLYAQGTPKAKSVLNSEISTQFPDNTTGAITPSIMRSVTNNFLASWQQYPAVNEQTGTTYTMLTGDYGKVVKFNAGASAVAVTLPGPSTFATGWNAFIVNKGTGTVTITPTGSTIDGAATFSVSANQSIWLVSDGSTTTNYTVWNFSSGTVTSVGMTVPCGTFSVTPNTIASSGTFVISVTGNSGGLHYYDSANCLQSSATLTANGVVYGGGAGVAPGAAAAGTLGQILVGTASAPSMSSQVRIGAASGTIGTITMFGGGTAGSTLSPQNLTAGNTLILPSTSDTLIGKATTDTLTNKTYDTAGTGNAFSINSVSVTTNTGTGAVVRQAAPTLNSPVLSGQRIGVNGSSVIGTNLPSVSANAASLDVAGQTVTGGAYVTGRQIGQGNYTVDCGLRPTQIITNNAAFTITAPPNTGTQEGFCILLVSNGASAGTITLSGFTVGSNTGDTYVTTNGSKFSLFVWRIGSIAAYSWFAHQ